MLRTETIPAMKECPAMVESNGIAAFGFAYLIRGFS